MQKISTFRKLIFILVLQILFLPHAGYAHKGHKDNMSDTELAQAKTPNAAIISGDATDVVDGHSAGEYRHSPAGQAAGWQEGKLVPDAAIAENRLTSAGDFFGRLHPVATHFPMALLLTAALAEIWLLSRPAAGLETAIRFLVAVGAAGAVTAAIFGWFAAGWRLTDRSETLQLHRWNGTGIAGVAMLAAWFAFRSKRRRGLRITLVLLSASLAVQGYLGGEMVFGPNHLGLQ